MILFHFLFLITVPLVLSETKPFVDDPHSENSSTISKKDENEFSILSSKLERIEKIISNNPTFVENYGRLKSQEFPIADYLKEVLVEALKARPLISKVVIGSFVQKFFNFIVNIVIFFRR